MPLLYPAKVVITFSDAYIRMLLSITLGKLNTLRSKRSLFAAVFFICHNSYTCFAQDCASSYVIQAINCNGTTYDVSFTVQASAQAHDYASYREHTSSVGNLSTVCVGDLCYCPAIYPPWPPRCFCDGITNCCSDVAELHFGPCDGTESIEFFITEVPSGQAATIFMAFDIADNGNWSTCAYSFNLPAFFCSTQTTCTGNPLNYSWMQTLIAGLNCQNCAIKIYKRQYLGQDVFEVRRPAGCANAGGDVYDCGGKKLFSYTATQNIDQIPYLQGQSLIYDCANVCANPPLPVLSGASVFCAGSSTALSTNAGFAQYNWSSGATTSTINISTSGTYTVTVRNAAGCTGTASKAVEALPQVGVNGIASNGLSGFFTLSGGQPQTDGSNYATVSMALQGNPAVTATLATAPFTHNETVSFTCPQAGTYGVTATDGAGCSGTGAVVVTALANPTVDTCGWYSAVPILPTVSSFSDIDFLDEANGLAVCSNGNIFRSVDGGLTWIKCVSNTTNQLYAVDFVSTNIGWAIADKYALKSTDGGQNWSAVNIPGSVGLRDVYFLNENLGWILDGYNSIYKTTDGGQNWLKYTITNTVGLSLGAIHFVNANLGFVSAESGYVFKTVNGGLNWTFVRASNQTGGLRTIYFTDANNGWVCGNNDGMVLHTSNSGASWSSQITIPGFGGFYSVRFFNSNIGITTINNRIYRTTNGGMNWTPVTLPALNVVGLGSIAIVNSTAWVCGGNGLLLKSSNMGQDWTLLSSGINDQLIDIVFPSAKNGWALGYYLVWKSVDGGQSWIPNYQSISSYMPCFYFLDKDNGWVVDNKTLLKTSNGGSTWNTTYTFTPYVSKIFFLNPLSGWAVGDNGLILSTKDGGVSWNTQNAGTSNNLKDIHFIDNQVGWIAGSGVILKTTNSGSNWNTVYNGFRWYHTIGMVDAANGYALGYSDVATTTDGGNSWVSKYNTANTLRSGQFISRDTGWILGYQTLNGTFLTKSYIYKTINGGNTWSPVTWSDSAYNLTCIYMDKHKNGWVGGLGTVLKLNALPCADLLAPAANATGISTHTTLSWRANSACTDGYRLSLSTTPSGTDLLNSQIVSDTFYKPAQPLPAGKTIYVRIVPYNSMGGASGCQGYSFTTAGACLTVTTTADAGSGSFREAVDCANANPGPDTIRFNLSGAGPHVIALSSPLPNITGNGTVILGQSQPGWSLGNLVLDGANLTAGTAVLGVLADSFEVYGLHIRDGSVGVAVYNRNNIKIGNQFVGNVISGAKSHVGIEISGSSKCQIEGNIIGLDPTASTANSPQMCCAIRLLKGQSNNTDIHILKNTLGGTKNEALYIEGSNVTVRDNAIGTNAAGTLNLGNGTGIKVGRPSSQLVKIGGNQIGFSNNDGIVVDSAQQVDIYANSLFCNATTGIRLLPGANANVPKPLIVSAIPGTVSGTSSLGGAGRIEIFKSQNTGCPAATCAQGKAFLGWAASNNLGSWTFSSAQIQAGDLLSATMTLNGGNFEGHTSAFSDCFAVASASCTTVTTTADAGAGSLREAINCANINPGPDTIRFNLAGPRPYVIKLGSGLPILSNSGTFIDGSTQPGFILGDIVLDCSGLAGINALQIHGANFCIIKGLHLKDAPNFAAITLYSGASNNRIDSNLITKCAHGIVIAHSNTLNNIISNNIIGTDLTGTVNLGGNFWAIRCDLGTNGNLIKNNTLAYYSNGGVLCIQSAFNNTITQNATYCNAIQGGIQAYSNPSTTPTIQIADFTKISGSAAPGAVVEIFQHNNTGCATAPCQGKTYLGTASADTAGNWILLAPFAKTLLATDYVTATATDAQNNTSAFSACTAMTPCNIIASSGQDTTLCISQSLTLTASGGTTYQWSDGGPASALWSFSPSITKMYRVTVTDARGCTGVDSVLVTVQSGLDCGLVAHYNLNGDAQDASGNGLHGQNFGAIPAQNRFGNCGQAMYFNNSYISVAHTDTLNFKNDFSLAFWFKKKGASFGHLLGKGRDNVNSYYFTANNGPNRNLETFSLYNSPHQTVLEVDSTTTQTWHHAVCMYDKTNQKIYLYLDGTLAASDAAGFNFVFNNTHPLVIGRHCTSANGCGGFPYYFNGWMDDLRLYARALSPAEITTLYTLPNNNPTSPPAAALTAPKTTLCPGDSTLLSAAPTQTGYTYTWLRDGNSIAGAVGNTYMAKQAGNYQVRVSSTAGCDSLSQPISISNNTKPNALIVVQDTLTCTKTTATLNASGGGTYTWSNGLGNNATATANAVGAYTVTVTGANGCTATASASVIEQKTLPTASASGGVLTCTTPVTTLQGSSSTPGAVFAWAGPGGFAFNGPNPPVSLAGTYTLTARAPNGCTNTATATVLADNTLPSADIQTPGGLQIDCIRANLSLQAANVPGNTYNWSGPNGFALNGLQATVSTPGTYILTVRNPTNGCANSSTVTVGSSTAKPNLSATGGTLTCGSAFVILQSTSTTPNATFAWAGPNGFAIAQQNPPVNVAGTYTLTVRDPANGCTNTATAAVLADMAQPNASIATPLGTTITCRQPSATLQAPFNADYTYQWSGNLGNGNSASAIQAGTYTVTVANTLNNCSATGTVAVSIDTAPPQASIATPQGTLVDCRQLALALQGSGGDAYVWSGPGGFAFNGPQPTIGLPGNYLLVVTNNANGCTGSATVSITGNTDKPAGIVAVGGALTCVQSSVVLNGSSTTPGATYAWIGPGGTPYIGATPSVGTTGTYTLVVSNPANGCSGTATAAVVSNTTAPVVNAAGGALGCISHACQLQGGSATSGAAFAWTGPGNFSSALPNPVVALAGSYTLVVLDPANGCSSSRSVVVTPEKQLKPTISGPAAFCGGAAVVLGAEVGFSQYLWSNSATTPAIPVSQGGVYSLSVADLEGCTGTATLTVVEHPAAVASLIANEGSGVSINDHVICAGETIQFTAYGGAKYQFYRNGQVWGGFTSNPVLSAANIANGEVFSVRIQDSNGCRDTTIAGEGPGYAPISVQVNPLPDWTGAALTMVRACPGKPVLLLLSCPQLPNGSYGIDYLLYGTNNLNRLNDTLLVQNGSALIDLGLLPNAGNTTIRLFGIRNAAACATIPLSGNTLTFTNGIGSQTVVEKTICKGQSFVWGGNTYNQSGSYSHTEISTSGCDSTVVLQLNVVTVLKESLAAAICQGKTYTFNGQTLTKAGIYIDSLKSFGGCDSLVTLALSVLPAPFSTLAKTICPGESFVLGGVSYDKTGTYTATLKTSDGCDSLVVLSLSVKALAIDLGPEKTVCTPTAFTLNATVPNCPDCTYTWDPAVSGNPSELTVKPAATSIYAVTVKDKQQCTATDQLRINVQDNIETKIEASICKGETYKLGNVVLKDPGEYDLELTTTAGCDSLIRLRLEVLNPGDYQTRPDTGYLLPDERYKDFDVLDNDRYLEDRALSIARQGRQGLAEIKDGLLRFTPNNNFLGYDTVFYALCPTQGCPQVCDTGFLLVLVQSGELEDLVNIMPNTITPNGDGQNDVFDPLGFLRLRGLYIPDEVTEMAIVSRQGELVFHPKRGEYRAWDATHRGREVPEGTYYYWLQFGDEPPIKGPVTVIR